MPLDIWYPIYHLCIQGRKKFYAGDITGAEGDSKNAKKWIISNLVVCRSIWLLSLGVFGLGLLGVFLS